MSDTETTLDSRATMNITATACNYELHGVLFLIFHPDFFFFVFSRVESNGDCRILEVSYQERPIHGSPGGLAYGGDQQRLREQLDTARYRHSALVAKQQRLLKQRQVLDGWADGLGRSENTEAVSVTSAIH